MSFSSLSTLIQANIKQAGSYLRCVPCVTQISRDLYVTCSWVTWPEVSHPETWPASWCLYGLLSWHVVYTLSWWYNNMYIYSLTIIVVFTCTANWWCPNFWCPPFRDHGSCRQLSSYLYMITIQICRYLSSHCPQTLLNIHVCVNISYVIWFDWPKPYPNTPYFIYSSTLTLLSSSRMIS